MKLILFRSKVLRAALCLAVAVAIIAFVNHPAFVGASGNVRQLPIYCVQKDYKVCALSFDAAWADACVRTLGRKSCGLQQARRRREQYITRRLPSLRPGN